MADPGGEGSGSSGSGSGSGSRSGSGSASGSGGGSGTRSAGHPAYSKKRNIIPHSPSIEMCASLQGARKSQPL